VLGQITIVALLVTGCTAYAAWTLMPAGARRIVAGALLKLPLPEQVARVLQRHLTAASGCGCDGCDQGSKKTRQPATVQPISFHPRIKR
jgi:hypothetical protein